MEILTKINNLIGISDEIKANIHSVLQDQTIPLETRWGIFEKITGRGILDSDEYSDGYTDMFDKYLLNLNPGNQRTYSEIYSSLKYNLQNYNHKNTLSQELLDQWREKVLACGYDRFTYD